MELRIELNKLNKKKKKQARRGTDLNKTEETIRKGKTFKKC